MKAVKKLSIYLLAASAAFLLQACSRELEPESVYGDNFLSFTLSHGSPATRAVSPDALSREVAIDLGETVDGKPLRLVETLLPAGFPTDYSATKAAPATSANAGDLYGSFTAVAFDGTSPVTIGRESSFIFYYRESDGIWGHLFPFYPWDSHSNLHFFMGMPEIPAGSSVNPSAGSISFTYASPAEATDQKDLLFGECEISKTAFESNPDAPFPVTFHHVLTGIQFYLGNIENGTVIQTVSLKNIVSGGSVVVTPAAATPVTWTPGSSVADYSLTASPDFSDESLTFWLVPQTLSNDAELEVTYSINGGTAKTVSVKINEALGTTVSWNPGELHCFTLNPDEVNVSISDSIDDSTGSADNPVILNSGNVAAYLRAVIVANWQDNDGTIVAPWDFVPAEFSGLPGSGWTLGEDGFYYTDARVAPGQNAPMLFTSYTPPVTPPVSGAHLVMDIAVQAVNTRPASWED